MREGWYVVLSAEDFDKVKVESTREIDLVQFAGASAVDPMYIDRTSSRPRAAGWLTPLR